MPVKAPAAGDLRDRVSVLKRSTSDDGQGGRATTWVDVITESASSLTRLAARVMPLRISERMQVASIGATLSYHVTLRYRADVTPKMRIQWTPYQATAAKTLEIHGVQALDGGRAFLLCECAEVI
jgi:SPP1 family predicted phage head-tail adaptor